MYSMWAMTCWPFLSALQMMYPGSGCLESSYQVAFPIISWGTLSFFRLWTCRYSLGSVFWVGIMCAISPGSLLLVTSMGVVMLPSVFRRVFLCYDTAESSSSTRVWRRLCDPRDDTKSCGLSIVCSGVRSVQRRKVTPWVLSNSLKGLILRQEDWGRGERGMWIGLQYYEE